MPLYYFTSKWFLAPFSVVNFFRFLYRKKFLFFIVVVFVSFLQYSTLSKFFSSFWRNLFFFPFLSDLCNHCFLNAIDCCTLYLCIFSWTDFILFQSYAVFCQSCNEIKKSSFSFTLESECEFYQWIKTRCANITPNICERICEMELIELK